MSEPTPDSIIKAFREAKHHYSLPLDLFCETLIKEVERLRTRPEEAIREAALEEAAKMADKAASQKLGAFKDVSDAMLGKAVLDGWQSCAKALGERIRALKSKSAHSPAPRVEAMARALPEIIDWLEVETLVYRTEGRAGNADFAARVVRLFKDCLPALAALKPFLGAIPEGWVLVPKKPSWEMSDAAFMVERYQPDTVSWRMICHEVWDAMLSAAPSPDGDYAVLGSNVPNVAS